MHILRVALVLGALLVSTVTPLSATGLAVPESEAMDALVAKADPMLAEAMEAGDGPFRVILTGPAHERVAEQRFASREDAVAYLDRESAPTLAALRAAAVRAGATVVKEWSVLPGILVEGDERALRALAPREDVRAITLDYVGALRLVDPLEPEEGGFGAANTGGREMVQAPEMWALGYRGEGIVITVIDTGIDPRHEAFKNADGSTRVAGWADFVNNRADPYDDHGHGTHVAGTALGSDDYVDPVWGAFQERGVAYRATLKVAKFLNGGGSGTFEAGIDALNWAFAEGSDITSNSWGGGCASFAVTTMQTVRTLTDAGMLSVFAAGNSGPGANSINGPGCSESALTVGAVDQNRAIAWFSSRGPCTDIEVGSPSRTCPDVVAKGVAVRSAIPRNGASWASSDGYRVWDGTSMATPHVAGVAALIEQMRRDIKGSGWDTAGRAEELALTFTALDLGSAGEDNTFGWGLVRPLVVREALLSVGANVISSLILSPAELRMTQTGSYGIDVRNVGGREATVELSASVTGPDGAIVWSGASSGSLGTFEADRLTTAITVTESLPLGEYVVRGRVDWSWTDDANVEHTGFADLEGTFTVRRPVVTVTFDGFPESAGLGRPQHVALVIGNVGNEAATTVQLRLTVPNTYHFAPGEWWKPLDYRTYYSSPSPREVEDREAIPYPSPYVNTGSTTLRYLVTTIAPGETFTVRTNLVAVTTDASGGLSGDVAYGDTVGHRLTKAFAVSQDLGIV